VSVRFSIVGVLAMGVSVGSSAFAQGTSSIENNFVVSAAASTEIAGDAETASSEIASSGSSPDIILVTGQRTVFGATKVETPIVEMARSISIETAELFQEKGAINLSQTAGYLAGVTSETFGFSTRGDWLSSRGLDIPRYRDSIQELFGSYNTTRVDIYTIEQVEILKGPASVLYGQGSPGGVLNTVSKTPREDFGGEIVAQFGNFDRRQIAGDVTGPLSAGDSSLLYRLVGVYRDTGSQVDYVDERTIVAMPSLTWTPTPATRFTLIGLYQDTEDDVGAQFIPVVGTLTPLPDGSYLDQDVYAGDPGFNHYDTTSTQVTVLGEHEFNSTFKLEGTALWRSGEADYAQAWPVFTGAGVSRYLNDALGAAIFTPTTVARSFYEAVGTSDQYAADIRLRADFSTGSIDHQVLSGVQYQYVETDTDYAYFFGGGALAEDFRYVLDLANPVYGAFPDQSALDAIYTDVPTQTVEDIGLYVSDQLSYGNWRFTAGVRADVVENDDGTVKNEDDAVSTSFGALYRFDNGFSPYVSFAESFETVVGTDVNGDQLKPQEARQYEVGFKYEPGFLPGLITFSYFDIEISNISNPNATPGVASQILGVSTLTGFELELRLQLDDFYVQAAAATLDAEDPYGYELASQPDLNVSLWTTWRPSGQLDGFKAGAGVRHVGRTVAEDGAVRYETPDYTLGDLMVGYEWDRWDFQVNARNITDEEYLTSCLTRGDCFPGLRRTVVGSLRYSF